MDRRKLVTSTNTDCLYHSDGFGLKSLDEICKEFDARLMVDRLVSDDEPAKEVVKYPSRR